MERDIYLGDSNMGKVLFLNYILMNDVGIKEFIILSTNLHTSNQKKVLLSSMKLNFQYVHIALCLILIMSN